jgi:hypothetical protein
MAHYPRPTQIDAAIRKYDVARKVITIGFKLDTIGQPNKSVRHAVNCKRFGVEHPTIKVAEDSLLGSSCRCNENGRSHDQPDKSDQTPRGLLR